MEYINQKYPGGGIILYGVSMGGATIAYLSDMVQCSNVICGIIDSSYISPDMQVKHEAQRVHLPYSLLCPYIRLCARIFLNIDICDKTLDHLKETKFPVMFIHGKDDPTVSLDQARENFESCSGYKEFLIVENAGHAVSFLTDKEKVSGACERFIENCQGRNTC